MSNKVTDEKKKMKQDVARKVKRDRNKQGKERRT